MASHLDIVKIFNCFSDLPDTCPETLSEVKSVLKEVKRDDNIIESKAGIVQSSKITPCHFLCEN